MTDLLQARECFNISESNVTAVPLPVSLNSTIRGDFICNDAAKPYIHRFFCTHYGNGLVWRFNGKTVVTFNTGDPPGYSISKTYSEPSGADETLVCVTALFIQEDNSTVNFPSCVSSLTVLPCDLNNFSVIPFTVSCSTFCTDDTEVCQVREYKIAGMTLYSM